MAELRINPLFYDNLLPSTDPIVVNYGARQSGKTDAEVQHLGLLALNNPQTRIIGARKYNTNIQQSIYRNFLSFFEKMEVPVKTTKTPAYIELPNHSEILFTGLDKTDNLKSLSEPHIAWVEEAQQLQSQEELIDIQMTLRGKSPVGYTSVHLTFNPVSINNWTYDAFFTRGIQQQNKNISRNELWKALIIHSTIEDNKIYLETEQGQRARDNLMRLKDINEHKYKIDYLGQFGVLVGRIYDKIFNWVDEPTLEEVLSGDLFSGLDWGYSIDPAAFVLLSYYDGKVYFIDEIYETGLVNSVFSDKVRALLSSYNIKPDTFPIYADSAEPKSIHDFNSYGLKGARACRKGPGSIQRGINIVQEYELHFHPRCVNALREHENYVWELKNGKPTDKPVGYDDHLVDSTRYAIEGHLSPRQKHKITVPLPF